MNKIALITVALIIGIAGCKKEENVTFDEEGESSVPSIVGTVWKPAAVNFDDYIEDMIVYEGKIILSYLEYADGSPSFSGAYNGTSVTRDKLSQSGSGFAKFKILNGELNGMGSVGVYGGWRYTPNEFNSWQPVSQNGNNYYDMEYLDNNLIIASSKSPYIHKGAEVMGDGFNSSVNNLLYFKGDLIAIGGFSASGSEEMSGIARWNGSQWEKLGGGLDGTAYTATVYNGKLAVGGRFKKADGRECNGIAIWDGSSWSDLDGGFQGEYDVVLSLLANGEELIVGGDFEEAGDVYSPYVIKWDGTQWVELPSSVPSSVGAMTIYNDKLYIVNGSNLDNNFFLRLD
ncbi:MAG: hypothetical protein ABF321_02160 [Bacteroidia bacterium]